MFKLVGSESFVLGKKKINCTIQIQAADGFTYEYSLDVGGKSLEKFTESRSKIQSTWCCSIDGVMTRVVLGKLHMCSRLMFSRCIYALQLMLRTW